MLSVEHIQIIVCMFVEPNKTYRVTFNVTLFQKGFFYALYRLNYLRMTAVLFPVQFLSVALDCFVWRPGSIQPFFCIQKCQIKQSK